MTITRYKAENQAPGTLQTIYTVPAGKIAKLVFRHGFKQNLLGTNIGDLKFIRTVYMDAYTLAVNSCGVYNASYSAQLLVGDRLIMGSFSSNSSNDAFVFNMFVNNDLIYTPLDIPSTQLTDYNQTAIDGVVKNIFKNEFILTAGETVQINTNSIDLGTAIINYDFTVYEENV